jgi:hypothetical protein
VRATSRGSVAACVKQSKGRMKNWIFALVLAAALADVGLRAQPGEQRAWFNLDFKGGTPQELVEAMRVAFEKTMTEPPALNIVVPDNLANWEVPAIQLRKVDAGTVFEMLNGIWRNDGLQWVRAGRSAVSVSAGVCARAGGFRAVWEICATG